MNVHYYFTGEATGHPRGTRFQMTLDPGDPYSQRLLEIFQEPERPASITIAYDDGSAITYERGD